MLRRCLYAWVLGWSVLLGYGVGRAGGDGVSGATGGSVATASSGSVGSAPGVRLAGDGSESRKIFTLTATLREVYDDNIFTAKTGRVGSFETVLSPSILVDVPMAESEFSARYTFGLTYYENRPGNALDTSHEFVAQYKHAFSERFHLSLAEQFDYATEPNLLGSTGTLFRSGTYYTNTINAGLSAQWTPVFGSSTSYANTVVRYEDATQSIEQDNEENIVSQNFSFAVLPKVSLVFGGIVDDVSYDHLPRGYTSYTGDAGLDWQALPSLSLGVRGGGSVTEAQQQGGNATVAPYGSLTLNWQLGRRSSLAFSYVHTVVPTDVFVAEGQIADRFDTTFRYDITPSLTAHVEGVYTHGQYEQSLLTPGTVPHFSEDDLAIDTGLSYHLDSHFDLEGGYTFSGVSSGLNFRDYTRDQVYVGVRGTY